MFSPPANVTDYTTFLYGSVGIPTVALPNDDGIIADTLTIAQDVVNPLLASMSGTLYVLAVYNLAADRLLNYAADQANQTYFRDMRKELRLNDFSAGVPAAVSDNGTSVGLVNPEWMKAMTLQDLHTLKTPYGRRYMEIAQSWGPTIWGAS